MDTSETYILQCEKAEKIQAISREQPLFTEGDWFAIKDKRIIDYRGECGKPHPNVMVFGETGWSRERYEETDKCIWLPRQDQLQDMVEEDAITQIQRLQGWIITDNYVPLGLPQPSMEQLWLAFVMKMKYGKAWDGTDWIPVKMGASPIDIILGRG